MKSLLLIAGCLLLFSFVTIAQTPGCTDPLASNYNPAATINNGSCTYPATSYTPVIKVDPLSDSVVETSGLEYAGGFLWTLNDKGGKPCIYRIDTASNTVLQRVFLANAVNNDWEDLAFDGTYFYIGDFGNNQTGGRNDLLIYKFPLSAIHPHNSFPVDTIAIAFIEKISFYYSNQPQPPVASGYNNTRFDCEAMIADNGLIHLFSKNWADNNCIHYIINGNTSGNYIATAVDTFATGYLVTAADKIPGEDIIVLMGYQNAGTGRHYLHVLSNYPGYHFFSGNKRQIDLPDATVMGQGEGICFRSEKYGYISNEKFIRDLGFVTITVNQKLRVFDLGNWVNNYFTKYTFTGNGNWSDSNNWQYGIKPPAVLYPGNEIIITPAPGGKCLLDIQYTVSPSVKLIVKESSSFIVNGHLNIQQ